MSLSIVAWYLRGQGLGHSWAQQLEVKPVCSLLCQYQQQLICWLRLKPDATRTELLQPWCCMQELGAAGLTKRPTSCMLVMPKALKGAVDNEESKEFETGFEDVAKRVKAVQPIF